MAEDQGQGSGTDQNADDQNAGDGGQDDKDKPDDADDGDSGDGTDDGSKATVSKSDFDKLFARMQAADRAKNLAETALREKEKAEMSDLDRTKAELEDERKKAEEAAAQVKTMMVENAFHRENKFAWHDVSDAIAALDLSGVEVTEDGKVTGMAAAIKDVAKRKPHYVKSKQEGSEEGDGDGPPAANGHNNGRRKGDKGEALDRAKLAQRFPALGK